VCSRRPAQYLIRGMWWALRQEDKMRGRQTTEPPRAKERTERASWTVCATALDWEECTGCRRGEIVETRTGRQPGMGEVVIFHVAFRTGQLKKITFT
jgi:hypothetical protein